MARQPGEERCFLSALLAQLTIIGSQPIRAEVSAAAAFEADLEQEDSSRWRSDRGLALVAGALAVPEPGIIGWVTSGPAQGGPSDEPLMEEGQEAAREGLLAIVALNAPLAGRPVPPSAAARTSWLTGDVLEAVSGPADAVKPPALACAAWQPQPAIRPQVAIQTGKSQAAAEQSDLSPSPWSENGQAQTGEQPLAAAHDGPQAAPDPSAAARMEWPLTIPQQRRLDRLATEVVAQPTADGATPVPAPARSTAPQRVPLPTDVYQPVTGGGPHVEIRQIGPSAVAVPGPLPSEEPAAQRMRPFVVAAEQLVASGLPSPADRLVVEGERGVQVDVSDQPELKIEIGSLSVTTREAVSTTPWGDHRLSGQPVVRRINPESGASMAPLGDDRPSDAKTQSAADDLGAEPQVATNPAGLNPEAVIPGAEVSPLRLLSRPMAQQALSEGDTMLAEPLVADLWRREVQTQGWEDSQDAGDEEVLTQAGEAPVASPLLRVLHNGKAARWEAALEAVEVSTQRAPFPAGQATAQSANATVADQQAMHQAGSERRQAFAMEQAPGEPASVMPPSSPVTPTAMELRAIAAKELWQRADQSRSAENRVRPLGQVPSADMAFGLPGSIGSQIATEMANSGEEVNSGRAVSLVFHELMDRVYVALQRGESEWRLQLWPHHLGHLEIRLSASAHGVALLMRAETPEAQALIQANLDQLRNGLAERGVPLERCEVVAGQLSAHGSSLTGQPGGWEGTASRSYDVPEHGSSWRAATWRPRAEPAVEARRVSTSRAHSLIDLQA